VREGYRDWQPTYETTVEDGMDLELLERIRTIPWRRMSSAADLGCGTGRTGVWLHRRGVASIDGVDVTPEMLAAAGTKGVYRRLVEGDVRASGLEAGSYPLVTCCLVDEHLPRLAPLYREAARLLDSAGWYVVVGYHPYFIMASGMPTHFDHPDGHPVAIETHLHLPSAQVEAALEAGFSLAEMHEALVDDAWIDLKPRWADFRGVPISFCMVWRRERAGSSGRVG